MYYYQTIIDLHLGLHSITNTIHFMFSEYSNTNNMTMSLANCDFPAGLVTLLTGRDETQKGSEAFCNHP